MKKLFLVLVCLLMTLLLSSCHIHIDTDPWPASPEQAATEPAPTEVMPVQQNPAEQPLVTVAPTIDEFVPIVTPTPVPSNDTVEPGFNG